APIGVPGPDVPWIELCLKKPHLGVGECHHFVLTINTGVGLLSSTPGIAPPRLSSPSRAWRSSLGGCVSQQVSGIVCSDTTTRAGAPARAEAVKSGCSSLVRPASPIA